MWDSQKKQKINKSAQILGQSGAVQFNNIEKDSREGSIVFTSSQGIVQSIKREPSHS